MGLDQYAYVAARAGQHQEYWAGVELNEGTGEFDNPKVSVPRQIAYWRKHPNLHGWMQKLWASRGNSGDPHDFNGEELELTWNDLDDLARAVKSGVLPETEGFFFGRPSDAEYYDDDLKFIIEAKAEVFLGLRVFYNSSW